MPPIEYSNTSQSKIDPVALSRLLGENITQAEIARRLKVTQPAVCFAKKKLNTTMAGQTAKAAPKIMRRQLNAVDQLQKINRVTNDLLDNLADLNRGGTASTKALLALQLLDIKLKDPRDLTIKACAEIRAQVKLQLDIFQALYDVQAAAEFQAEVLQTIAETDPDVRDRIIHNLFKKHAIRAAIQQPKRPGSGHQR